ncbi:hypothetical protein MHK_007323, partial [Candidatus Magnetomorum sp. HK-1]
AITESEDCSLIIDSEVDNVLVKSSRIQEIKTSFLQETLQRQIAASRNEEYIPQKPINIRETLWTSVKSKKIEKKLIRSKYTINLSKKCYPTQTIDIDFTKLDNFTINLKKEDWEKYAYLRLENTSSYTINVEINNDQNQIQPNQNIVKVLPLGEYNFIISAPFKKEKSINIRLNKENEILIYNIETSAPAKSTIKKPSTINLEHGEGVLKILSNLSNSTIQLCEKSNYSKKLKCQNEITQIKNLLAGIESTSYTLDSKQEEKVKHYQDQLNQYKHLNSSIESIVLKVPDSITLPAGEYVSLFLNKKKEFILNSGEEKIISFNQ